MPSVCFLTSMPIYNILEKNIIEGKKKKKLLCNCAIKHLPANNLIKSYYMSPKIQILGLYTRMILVPLQ